MTAPSRLTPEYKAAQAERHKRWYQSNKQRVYELNREWIKLNPKKRAEQRERYWLVEKPDAKEKRLDRSRRWYRDNLDDAREKNRVAARAKLAAMTPRQRKERKLLENFGMTHDEWDVLFETQGSACAICRSTDPGCKAGWHTDHDHKTGKVRFILCGHCNRGLGGFRDSPIAMRRAADLLEAIQHQPARPVAAIAEAEGTRR